MKIIYRISDAGYSKIKPAYINNEHCLKNAVKVFSWTKYDWSIIADNLQFIVKGTHMIDWVTTYPFQEVWGMDVPLYEINGIKGRAGDIPPASPITIGNDVWIASNVKIKQGVTVGDGAVLATECFVTKDVPPYAVVGGNPAKIIRYRFTEEQRRELLKIRWWDWEDDKIKEVVPLLLSKDIDKFIEIAKLKK